MVDRVERLFAQLSPNGTANTDVVDIVKPFLIEDATLNDETRELMREAKPFSNTNGAQWIDVVEQVGAYEA